MRILVADDDPVSLRLLEKTLGARGHDVTVVCDGRAAWSRLQRERYDLVVTDWMMPGIDGVELCRRMRSRKNEPFCFVMLITARGETKDIVEGIMAGAHDFMTKPWKRAELEARVCAAERVVRVERTLARKVVDLERALHEVAALQRILPICTYCKSIRNDDEAWSRIDEYMQREGVADFTHAICPGCYEGEVEPMLAQMRHQRESG